ncbi:MAG: UDP-N-acetylmuramate dehydrogenase [bacterium]|nr:UDP-N-acetylmuramate dehydrogenase [bacterium]
MELKENILLAPYTNFRVGGPADFFVEAKNTDELKEASQFAKKKNVPVVVLGGGANILISDAGFRGLVIRIVARSLSVKDGLIVADAGCTMGQVVAEAQKAGLTGLEWAVGLPGTVGGAVFGNAGCFGGETKDVVYSVELLDLKNYELRIVDYKELEPGYRHSNLKKMGDIVVSATFKLKKGDAKDIAASMEQIRQKSTERIKEQPLGAWTAGSTFKGVLLTENDKSRITDCGLDWKSGINRTGYLSAGWLLEQTGLKGYRVGDALFSSHHANFIINHGKASASDILHLIDTAKLRVMERFGIELKEEIRYIGFEDRE